MFCLCATIILSIYSIHRYLLNEDTTLVKVTKFLSSKDAIYPSFSICILTPFLEDKFQVYEDADINITSYKSFLEGTSWDSRMLMVDYDNVTVSLSDNFIEAGYKTQMRNEFAWKDAHYVSFRASNRKCFTINAPFPSTGLLWSYWIKFKNDILPGGERSLIEKIKTYLHYPGQRLTAYYTINSITKDFTSTHNNSNKYYIGFRVRNIGVITRRNKKQDSCLEDWKYFDWHFMEYKMNEVGCRPPHWKTTSGLPICADAISIKQFSNQPSTFEIENFNQPCRVINQLDYFYREKNLDDEE